MAWDLPGFVARLEQEHPDLLARIQVPVDANNFEVSALCHRMQEENQNRVLLFERANNVAGGASEFPLLCNVYWSRALCAYALGLPADDWRQGLVEGFARLQQTPGRTELVSSGAPCQEVVLQGAEADVRRLPVPMYHEDDVGHYLVMTCIMKSPAGFYDATMTKNLILGPDQMSISAHGFHHLSLIIKEYEAQNRPAPVVIVMGHHPAFHLGTCALTPYGNEDYETIAGFMGGELRLAPSVTWGDEILVPADAELIIEGEVVPGERVWQNPFGEISGHYQEHMQVPMVRVKAITHRRGAIVQTVFPGHAEHWNLGGVPKEGGVFAAIRRGVPGVKAVHLPLSGCARFSAYVALKKRDFSDVTKAAMQAFSEVQNLKVCVMVDPDVDVFNEQEVLWAVSTQCRWEEDFQLFERVQNFRKWLGHAGAVIDATHPDLPDYPKRNRIPAAALAKVDLRRYFG